MAGSVESLYTHEGLRLLNAIDPEAAAEVCVKLLATKIPNKVTKAVALISQAGVDPWVVALAGNTKTWQALQPLGVNPALMAMVKSHGLRVREKAAQVVTQPGQEALLMALTKDREPSVRQASMSGLVARGGEWALARLVWLAKDPEGEVREAAAVRLRHFPGHPGALAALVCLAKDKNSPVRQAAAESLIKFNESTEAQASILALAYDENVLVQFSAARALDHLRSNKKALRALCDLAERNKESFVRGAAVRGLANRKSSATATRALVALVSDEDASIRHTAAQALGKPGAKGHHQALLDRLRDASPRVRLEVARFLAALKGDPAALEGLLVLVKDRSADVREVAVMGLGAHGDNPEAMAALRAVYKNEGGKEVWRVLHQARLAITFCTQ